MPNALIHEKSPYLLQHAHNPVDWLPWADAAFAKAERENKPVFLSIGYSTCHWCHVMERESFENHQIAKLLNENFVSIKVDREERPDVDRVYMLFVQASTGSGGWPMSVWLTPDRKPFFGGTYFPPDSRWGRPGFPDVLTHIAEAWRTRRNELVAASERVIAQLKDFVASPGSTGDLSLDLFHSGFLPLRRSFDREYGGFGSAPKFPRPVAFNYLLREYATTQNEEALEMVTATLRAMRAGGMNDHLGGGFHRYSVDRYWFVPHFEKMLYDQAQLASSFLEAFQITKDAEFELAARQIFSYVLRDMQHIDGGFYCAEDADSPDPDQPSHKAEGAFYVWRQNEIEQLLGSKAAALFCFHHGVKPDGNVAEDPHGEFSGKNILFEAASERETAAQFSEPEQSVHAALCAAREKLFDARSRRPRPHLDDKVLTSWNALMISALAKGAQVLNDREYLAAAQRAAAFLLETMYAPETGILLRRFREGEAAVPGFLDDYAFLAQALLDLFEADSDPDYLKQAARFASEGLAAFENTQNGGFFSTAETSESMLLRIRDDYDSAEPSGNSVATDVLLRLAEITGNAEYRHRAERSLRSFAPTLIEQPAQAPQIMAALGRYLATGMQVIIRCREVDAKVETLLSEYRRDFQPWRIVLAIPDRTVNAYRDIAGFLSGLERKGSITVYECANFVCQLPRVIY